MAATVPILFGVSVLTFALVHLTPGDPIDQMVALNPQISAAEEAAIRARYGLDGPVWQQYLTWIGNVLQGDLGTVISVDQPVLPYIMARLPETIALGLFGWAIALLISIPTGIYAAVNKDTLDDHLSRVFALRASRCRTSGSA